MRTEPATQQATTKDQVIAHLKQAIADRPGAIEDTAHLLDSLARKPAHLQIVLLTSAGPESRLVADMVTRLITGAGIPKTAVCTAMSRTPTTWPTLSRTHGARSIALLEDGETVGAPLATAWLRKLARLDEEQATVFIELAGPRLSHTEIIDATNTLASEHKPLIEVHVIDLATNAKAPRD
jgi:hypothetical protein